MLIWLKNTIRDGIGGSIATETAFTVLTLLTRLSLPRYIALWFEHCKNIIGNTGLWELHAVRAGRIGGIGQMDGTNTP